MGNKLFSFKTFEYRKKSDNLGDEV